MSIRKFVESKIADIRAMIAVWDNPTASQEEKGKVLAMLLGDEPKFWAEVAKRASATKRAPTMKAEEIVQAAPKPVAATKKVVAVAKPTAQPPAKPVPATPVSATGSARTLKVQPAAAGTSVFASMLNGAAKEIGLEDHTPLGRFRTLLKTDGRKGEYWKELRELLGVCLQKKLIQEVSDWKLLVTKAKKNLFFAGKKGEAFLDQCPKEGIADLLLADDGLWRLIDAIKTEGEINDSTPFHLGFMLDACVVVGKEAKELLIDCKHAVNHMKQTKFIPRDHWLVQKVAAMKAPAPCSTPVSVTSAEPSSEAAADHKLNKIQEVVEAVAEEATAEKPESLGPEVDAQFAQAMMAAAGEVIPDVDTMSEEDLERLTAPTLAVN